MKKGVLRLHFYLLFFLKNFIENNFFNKNTTKTRIVKKSIIIKLTITPPSKTSPELKPIKDMNITPKPIITSLSSVI